MSQSDSLQAATVGKTKTVILSELTPEVGRFKLLAKTGFWVLKFCELLDTFVSSQPDLSNFKSTPDSIGVLAVDGLSWLAQDKDRLDAFTGTALNATDLTQTQIEQLPIEDLLVLVAAIYEVNQDFFMLRLRKTVAVVQAQIQKSIGLTS